MNAMSSLIFELEDSLAKGSQERRADTLRRITDLFLRDSASLSPEQVDLFDVVIARLATAIETRARVDLAERLSSVTNAPSGIIRTLAHDDIAIARSVLTQSPKLSEDDLVAVAVARGRDHMLAISERPHIGEKVTDVLVNRGDKVVVHAVASNTTAKFSQNGMNALFDRSRADEALQALLTERDDIPAHHMESLLSAAKDKAQRNLEEALPQADQSDLHRAIERSVLKVQEAVSSSEQLEDFEDAGRVIQDLVHQKGGLLERHILDFADEGRFAECVCALSYLTRVTQATIKRTFANDPDLLLVLARSQNWSWPTVKAVLKLRGLAYATPQALERAYDGYARLTPATAQRVIHFLRVREETDKASMNAQIR